MLTNTYERPLVALALGLAANHPDPNALQDHGAARRGPGEPG